MVLPRKSRRHPSTIRWCAGLMWVTLSFWTADLLLNFFRGYHQAGYVQLDLDKIAARYLRLVLVIPQCI
eukprot:4257409-Amphidinium_carterae.1